MCFSEFMNEDLVEKLDALGCTAVLPDSELVTTNDVRYIEQLRAFQDAGIEDVIYIQSFGCLKGHVEGRGALRELSRLFPQMRITVIDYDPESSSLNRDNRILLAAAQATEA